MSYLLALDQGKPLAPAIIWQDRRAADWCNQLIQNNQIQLIQDKTGLRIDPYFSAGARGLPVRLSHTTVVSR